MICRLTEIALYKATVIRNKCYFPLRIIPTTVASFATFNIISLCRNKTNFHFVEIRNNCIILGKCTPNMQVENRKMYYYDTCMYAANIFY